MSRSLNSLLRMIACWVCGLATALLGLSAPARAQVMDHDAMLKQQRQQREMQFKGMQTMVTSFPALPANQIQDVLQLKMQGSSLEFTSPLLDPGHATGGFRLACNEFKGPTYVSVAPMGVPVRFGAAAKAVANLNPPMPRIFCFTNYDMPDPDDLVTLTIQYYGERLQINRLTQCGAGEYRRVILIQQCSPAAAGAAAPGQSPVQLNVNEFGDLGAGGFPRNLSIQAADFQTLLREHGREAEEFVRPLFRQLAQEAALAPDGHVAWQVLADHWRPDPELTRKVQQLLPTLNDLDFHARDKALAQLQAMGMPGAAVLLHLDRMGLSPEQNLMIDRTLAPFAQLSPRDAARLRSDTEFLTDCLYIANPDVRAAALDRLKQVTGKELTFDLAASDAARPAAVAELRKQLAAKPAEGPTTDPAKS